MSSSQCGRSYGKQACRIENEVVIAIAREVPTDVAVAGIRENRFVTAWSADGATWIASIDANGRLTSKPARVGCCRGPAEREGVDPSVAPNGTSNVNRGDASGDKTFWPRTEQSSIHSEHIDLQVLGDGKVALAMLGKTANGEQGGAYVAIWPSAVGTEPMGMRLGPAGEYATGISAAALGDRLIVAWHEGELGVSRLRLARVSIPRLEVEKQEVIVSPGMLASPVLTPLNGRPVMAWTQTVKSDTEPMSLVNTALITPDLQLGTTSKVATCRFIYPSPDITAVKDGLGLVFRDDADKDGTPEFYFTMLNPDASAASEKQRISQADGLRGPSLVYFNNAFHGATIRSFQRSFLIGLNRFDKTGIKLGGEFQVYADKSDFVRVDISANEKTLMMVYAEDRRNMGRVIAARVNCSTR